MSEFDRGKNIDRVISKFSGVVGRVGGRAFLGVGLSETAEEADSHTEALVNV